MMNDKEWLDKEKNRSAEWFARQNSALFGVSRDGRCTHHTTIELVSTTNKKFKVLVRCDDYNGHLGSHVNIMRNVWTSTDSLNEKGKKVKQ